LEEEGSDLSIDETSILENEGKEEKANRTQPAVFINFIRGSLSQQSIKEEVSKKKTERSQVPREHEEKIIKEWESHFRIYTKIGAVFKQQLFQKTSQCVMRRLCSTILKRAFMEVNYKGSKIQSIYKNLISTAKLLSEFLALLAIKFYGIESIHGISVKHIQSVFEFESFSNILQSRYFLDKLKEIAPFMICSVKKYLTSNKKKMVQLIESVLEAEVEETSKNPLATPLILRKSSRKILKVTTQRKNMGYFTPRVVSHSSLSLGVPQYKSPFSKYVRATSIREFSTLDHCLKDDLVALNKKIMNLKVEPNCPFSLFAFLVKVDFELRKIGDTEMARAILEVLIERSREVGSNFLFVREVFGPIVTTRKTTLLTTLLADFIDQFFDVA